MEENNKKAQLSSGLNAITLAQGVRGVYSGSCLVYGHILTHQYISVSISRQSTATVCSWDCSMAKSNTIGRARSPVTPIQPNWTDEPAVIKSGYKQHLSGMEPQKRGVLIPKKSQKRFSMNEFIDLTMLCCLWALHRNQLIQQEYIERIRSTTNEIFWRGSPNE